jgi:hypothetical protein
VAWFATHGEDIWVNIVSGLLIDLAVLTVFLPMALAAYENWRWRKVRKFALREFTQGALQYRVFFERNARWLYARSPDGGWAERQVAEIDALIGRQQQTVQTCLPVLNPELTAPVLSLHFKWLAMMGSWRQAFSHLKDFSTDDHGRRRAPDPFEARALVDDLVSLEDHAHETYRALLPYWRDHAERVAHAADFSPLRLDLDTPRGKADAPWAPEGSEPRMGLAPPELPDESDLIAHLMVRMADVEQHYAGRFLPIYRVARLRRRRAPQYEPTAPAKSL